MIDASNKAHEAGRRLGRAAAAEYVTATFGLPCSPLTLAKLASIGGGPLFRKSPHAAIYDTADLDTWAAAKIGPLVRTASEARKAA